MTETVIELEGALGRPAMTKIKSGKFGQERAGRSA
jgi:hypothetical protein